MKLSTYFVPLPALDTSSQHNPSHHDTQTHVRPWLITEGKAYKFHNGRRQHHRGQGCSSNPSLDLFKLMQIWTLLHRHEFEAQIKKKENHNQQTKKPTNCGITIDSIPCHLPCLLSQNSCSFSKNRLAAHETVTESNSLIHSLYILVV